MGISDTLIFVLLTKNQQSRSYTTNTLLLSPLSIGSDGLKMEAYIISASIVRS